MKKKKINHIFNILLVILSMITIFLFSSENAQNSSNTSKAVVKDIVRTVMKDETKALKVEKTITDNIHLVRKAAHLTEFFLLGFLLINLLKDYKKMSYKLIIISLIICILYACSDELHQVFQLGRAGRITDVLIDSIGSSLGIIIYYLIYSKYNKKDKKLVS